MRKKNSKQPKLSCGIKGFTDDNGRWQATGTQMGRPDNLPPADQRDHPYKFFLRNIMDKSDQAYDEEGAYWGSGLPVFWACCTDHDNEAFEEQIEMFFRDHSRDSAKNTVRNTFPNAKFYS